MKPLAAEAIMKPLFGLRALQSSPRSCSADADDRRVRGLDRPKLEAVVFDDAGPDVAAWLRRVGFMLSTSDDESFRVAPAEGMASRAVTVFRHWPGAETIYDMRWIHRGPPRWRRQSWRSPMRTTGARRATRRTWPPPSTWRGCARPGTACSPRAWARRYPARSSSYSGSG
jgi:hypothetical protein